LTGPRQQIDRALYTFNGTADTAAKGAKQCSFADPDITFKQQMSTCKRSNRKQPNCMSLPEHRCIDIRFYLDGPFSPIDALSQALAAVLTVYQQYVCNN